MLPSITMGKKNPIYFGNISHLMHLEFLGNLGSIRKKKKGNKRKEKRKLKKKGSGEEMTLKDAF